MSFSAVVTTIQPPTNPFISLHALLSDANKFNKLVVVADKKGPSFRDYEQLNPSTLEFLGVDKQQDLYPEMAASIPFNMYSRKNLGFIHSYLSGDKYIYETDDDTQLLSVPNLDHIYSLDDYRFIHQQESSGFNSINIYRYFTDQNIWPRGLPLDSINTFPHSSIINYKSDSFPIYIVQGLINNSPDVDAIWRLTQDRPFNFDNNTPLVLDNFNYTPFNTQNTWHSNHVYPLLYIPSFCSFRMCDIWRSFISQRCMWELGSFLVYRQPDTKQIRNYHNLISDFEDESVGYLRNKSMIESLSSLKLQTGLENLASNIYTCYETLVASRFFPEEELSTLKLWLNFFN